MACACFYNTKKVNYVDFMANFWENLLFEGHTNTPQMLREKYEIIISIIK